MTNQTTLQEQLDQFTGTEEYHRYNPLLFPNTILTDGALYLATEAQAFWLIDAIASHLPSVNDYFAIATLNKKENDQWVLQLADDVPANKVYAKQTFEYSTFPLDEFKIYVQRQDQYWVIFLPSEY